MKYFLLILSLAFICTSCKKNPSPSDPCLKVTCFNGGTCVDGSCDCPPGYSGVTCEMHDSCYGIICLHDGNCVNGLCDCPDGYAGPNCGTVLTPVYMSINKVILNRYPVIAPTGESWDPTSGPDIFITINPGKDPKQTDYVSPYYEDASGVLTFTKGLPKKITIASNWAIYTWDHESEYPDEIMGGFYFQADTKEGHFPATVHCGNENSLYYFTMEVTWIF